MDSSIKSSLFTTQQDVQKHQQKNNLGNIHEDTLKPVEDRDSPNMDFIIDSRIKGRVGSPMLPVLPVDTRRFVNVEKKFPDWPTHLERIKRILVGNDITPNYTGIVYRLHAESELSDDYITIMTRAIYEPESDVAWQMAVREIRKYLNQATIHCAIEIIAENLDSGLASYPFATDIYRWNDALLPNVCSLLHDRQWITLDMVYREDVEGAGNKRPTIVIGARDADEQYWWEDTLSTIQQLPQVAQSDIQVELQYRFRFLTANPNGALMQESFKYDQIEFGASCGSGKSTGTLGGPMRLKNPETHKELTFVITNHHVLAEHLKGEGPFTTFGDPIKVQSPSSQDRDFHAKDLEKQIDRQMSEVKARNHPGAKRALRVLEDELARVRSFDLHVGQVFASSGFRWTQWKSGNESQTSDWPLDWCLATVGERDTPITVEGPGSIGWTHVTGYCSIDPCQGYRVFKKGRTSGATTGYISATQSLAHLKQWEPEDGVTAPPRDLDMFPKGVLVRCHIIIPEWIEDKKLEYIQRGDSGSLVLLDPSNFALKEEEQIPFEGLSGEPAVADWNPPWRHTTSSTSMIPDEQEDGKEAWIAGLAFGGHDRSLLSYMIPMDLVVQDIESVTKWEVVEPKFAGIVRRDKVPRGGAQDAS